MVAISTGLDGKLSLSWRTRRAEPEKPAGPRRRRCRAACWPLVLFTF